MVAFKDGYEPMGQLSFTADELGEIIKGLYVTLYVLELKMKSVGSNVELMQMKHRTEVLIKKIEDVCSIDDEDIHGHD